VIDRRSSLKLLISGGILMTAVKYMSHAIIPTCRKTIFTLLLTLKVSGLLSQPDDFKFSHIDINDGLSNNQITCIFKDSLGFMWFGTMSGLNRFDGHNFKVFRHDIRDTSSIIDNFINSIFEDHLGKMWVGTRNGYNIYDPCTETFNRNPASYLQALAIHNESINKSIRDITGNYWYISPETGIYKYQKKSNTIVNIRHNPRDSSSLATDSIADIYIDSHNDFWIIHHNGILEKMDCNSHRIVYRNNYLYREYKGEYLEYVIFIDSDEDIWIYVSNFARGIFYFDVPGQTVLHFDIKSSGVRLNTNIVNNVAQDNKGLIWIGTDHGGINLLDKKTLSIRYLIHDDEDEKSISQNSITSLFKDDLGIMWAGTFKKGINYYNEDIFKFRLFKHKSTDPNSLCYDDVNCFAEDAKGNLWIGTNGGGLLFYNRINNRFTRFINEPDNHNSISNDIIVSLCIDHLHNLWIGTFYGGLNCFDGRKFTRYRHDPSDPESISDDRIWEIFEDSQKNLWIGTLGGGLDKYNRKKNKFEHYANKGVNALHSDFILSIIEDKEGDLWIGSAHGIDVIGKASGHVTHYAHDINNPGGISNNNVLSIAEDIRGMIWVGTREGLNLFDRKNEIFMVFRTEDGLPDNAILTIQEDNNGNLWISTPNGLSNLLVSKDPDDGEYRFAFKNYDESDGLQGKEFNEGASFKTIRGELIFGGPNGFNIFHPYDIKENKVVPGLVFTDFQIFNKSIGIGEKVNGRVILEQSVPLTDKIILKYRENVFSVEFAAFSYSHQSKNKYAYILEGFNTDWLTTDGNLRKATFTNLDQGEYVLRVKASNSDGYWNDEGISMKIKILPPFWKTPLAIIIYVIIVIGILLFSRKLILDRERVNHRIQQERQQAKHMHELDMMKIKFFTNVSHELRTPLSLITSPLDNMMKSTKDPEQKRQFLLISRNIRRLLNLVNQLLDFRKMEVEEFTYNPVEADIISYIKDVAESFSDLAEKKKIDFSIRSGINSLEMLFDQDKLEKIMFNLLSNAFKFTHEHGSISVTMNLSKKDDVPGNNNKWLDIKVTDTGIGIPADKHDKIFERFFQNLIPGSIVNKGSGIGLALTKEFVKLHGGTISLEGEPDNGSCFSVLLPVKHADEFITGKLSAEMEMQATADIAQQKTTGHHDKNRIDHKKPLVLLVDDNHDFRFYLKDNLKQYYNIIEASNGKEGWRKIINSMPDLIVSDIIMSEMDGIELCRKIKGDQRTSHIPVILLTARAGEKERIVGFNTGADDYITKPFNFEILRSRIKNLITLRESMRKNYLKHIEINPREINITSLDEKLIQKALDLVENNISDSDFSVKRLSHELGMSRVHLYKKLSSLTGKTPIEFIRIIRLKRAAQLLEKSQLTISEVAYEVGFNNPKYFAKYFKSEFNILPSQYAVNKRKTKNIPINI
jgi:signal transduction histidine kinase/ligand-binding sensor domain-containing protein/DNA-binding response OmpR family regulator